MAKGLYGGSERRRGPRYNRRFRVLLEYQGKTHAIRTIDISEYGVHIPMRIPPPIGTRIKLTLTIRGENSIFEGVVIRRTKSLDLVNGVLTGGIGIDFSSPEYQTFVKDKICIA